MARFTEVTAATASHSLTGRRTALTTAAITVYLISSAIDVGKPVSLSLIKINIDSFRLLAVLTMSLAVTLVGYVWAWINKHSGSLNLHPDIKAMERYDQNLSRNLSELTNYGELMDEIIKHAPKDHPRIHEMKDIKNNIHSITTITTDITKRFGKAYSFSRLSEKIWVVIFTLAFPILACLLALSESIPKLFH